MNQSDVIAAWAVLMFLGVIYVGTGVVSAHWQVAVIGCGLMAAGTAIIADTASWRVGATLGAVALLSWGC